MKKIWIWLSKEGNAITAFVCVFAFILIIVGFVSQCEREKTPVEKPIVVTNDSIKGVNSSIEKQINNIDSVRNEYIKKVDLDTLLSQSDIVSLHCPLTKDNAKMINADSISKIKKGASSGSPFFFLLYTLI